MFEGRWGTYKFTNSFGSPESLQVWRGDIGDLTDLQIKQGLTKLRDMYEFDWPPSSNVFRAICLGTYQPKGQNSEQAHAEAMQQTQAYKPFPKDQQLDSMTHAERQAKQKINEAVGNKYLKEMLGSLKGS